VSAALHQQVAQDQAQTGLSHGFLPLDLALLKPGPKRMFDLYVGMDQKMVLFCAKDYSLRPQALAKLRDEDQLTLYVPVEQGPMVSRHAERMLKEVVRDGRVTTDRRAHILHTSARTIMADILANPTSKGVVRRGVGLANATVDLVIGDPGALKCMTALFTRDYYTYTHSVHTCVLGVAFYKYVITSREEMLRRFGFGMLLHDTGKSVVDSNILNKPGRLTPEEFEHLKRHPTLGWQILEGHGVNDDLIRQAVLFHHEKLNGEGYPMGLSHSQVSEPARVAGIVDVYDALTTDRPYRPAMTHDVAMELMRNTMVPQHLDAEYFAAFERLSRSFAV